MIKTKHLALGAMGCALSFIFLSLCTALPTGRLVMGFIASFVPCIIFIESSSLKTSLISGIASALLALITLPKTGLGGAIIIAYSICLCYYPALKALIEKKQNLIVEWMLKLIYFVAISLLIYFISLKFGIYLFNVYIGILALAAYDLLLTYSITYYIRFISPRIKKSR